MFEATARFSSDVGRCIGSCGRSGACRGAQQQVADAEQDDAEESGGGRRGGADGHHYIAVDQPMMIVRRVLYVADVDHTAAVCCPACCADCCWCCVEVK